MVFRSSVNSGLGLEEGAGGRWGEGHRGKVKSAYFWTRDFTRIRAFIGSFCINMGALDGHSCYCSVTCRVITLASQKLMHSQYTVTLSDLLRVDLNFVDQQEKEDMA